MHSVFLMGIFAAALSGCAFAKDKGKDTAADETKQIHPLALDPGMNQIKAEVEDAPELHHFKGIISWPVDPGIRVQIKSIHGDFFQMVAGSEGRFVVDMTEDQNLTYEISVFSLEGANLGNTQRTLKTIKDIEIDSQKSYQKHEVIEANRLVLGPKAHIVTNHHNLLINAHSIHVASGASIRTIF